jgi:hypothetical protein
MVFGGIGKGGYSRMTTPNRGTIKLITAITALVIALSGAGAGGWFLKGEDIKNLEQANKDQDKVLGNTVHKTLDLDGDMLEVNEEIRELRRSIDSLRIAFHEANAKLDILVEGYSGN